MGETSPAVKWDVDISLLRTPVLLRQLALALGIPVLLLFVFLLILEWPIDAETLREIGGVSLLVAGILVVLLLIAILVVYGGRYEYQYSLDAQGIEGRPRGRTTGKNRLINWLLVLSGRPSAMGAGLLAAARQVEYVRWSEVNDVMVEPNRKTIVLRKSRRPHMVVFCDDAHYEEVLGLTREAVAQAHAAKKRKN